MFIACCFAVDLTTTAGAHAGHETADGRARSHGRSVARIRRNGHPHAHLHHRHRRLLHLHHHEGNIVLNSSRLLQTYLKINSIIL